MTGAQTVVDVVDRTATANADRRHPQLALQFRRPDRTQFEHHDNCAVKTDRGVCKTDRGVCESVFHTPTLSRIGP